VHKRLCTRATPEGRVILTGNTLKLVGEETTELRIEEAEYTAVLAERFGMKIENQEWRKPTCTAG
jgi:arylamine N-acetyltransferase